MVFVLEPVERHPQMNLALTPQDGLVGLAVGLDVQRGVLVGELGEGARQLDLVVAVGGRDRERVHVPRGGRLR